MSKTRDFVKHRALKTCEIVFRKGEHEGMQWQGFLVSQRIRVKSGRYTRVNLERLAFSRSQVILEFTWFEMRAIRPRRLSFLAHPLTSWPLCASLSHHSSLHRMPSHLPRLTTITSSVPSAPGSSLAQVQQFVFVSRRQPATCSYALVAIESEIGIQAHGHSRYCLSRAACFVA